MQARSSSDRVSRTIQAVSASAITAHAEAAFLLGDTDGTVLTVPVA